VVCLISYYFSTSMLQPLLLFNGIESCGALRRSLRPADCIRPTWRVVPAQAGTQLVRQTSWIPACAGMTGWVHSFSPAQPLLLFDGLEECPSVNPDTLFATTGDISIC
jgi:hypothetical protein